MRVKTNKPLYKIVTEETLDKLSSGVLKIGHRFPPEVEYAADLGVSRHTLRQAFSQLEHAGVIKRRKRGGTEVIARKPLQRFNSHPAGFYNLLGVVRETLFDLTDVSTVDQRAHAALCNDPSESSEWVCFTGTRTMRDQTTPFVWSQVYVTDEFSEINVQAGDRPATIYQLIQERFGDPITRVKQRYSAQICSDEIGDTLGLKHGSPVLNHVIELFNDEGVLLELADSLYDPTRSMLKTEVNVANNFQS